MKSTELRIGSLVEYNGMIMKVYEICSPKPRKEKRYSDKYVIELFDGSGLLDCALDEIKPIQLTEEWLLRFGFGTGNKLYSDFLEHWYYKYHLDDFEINLPSGSCSFKNTCIKNIQYVHQLQNLYFALTGQELAIVKPIK